MAVVSVIIPTYNHRDFVRATLDSVFAQTFTDYEVIVVDDGSPDDTAELLQPLADAGQIKLIRQPNAGQAAARNRGIAEATGEFIALLDDDDLWSADKLSWQVESLRHSSVAVGVGGSVELIDKDDKPVDSIVVTAGELTAESIFEGNPFWSPGQVLIRADALRAAGVLDTTVPGADDYDLWFKLARMGRLLTDPRPGLRYRLHAANASNDLLRMSKSCRTVVLRHLAKIPPADRGRLGRAFNRWLYHYLGSKSLVRLRADARKLNLVQTVRSARILASFFLPALTDRRLRTVLLADVANVCAHHWPLRLVIRTRVAPAA